MNKNLLILSAELISEDMQKYLGKLPSAMIPFQNKTALEFIYHENFNHYDNIYIVTYKENHFIQEYLNNSQFKIKLLKLPHIHDLASSLKFGLENISNSNPVTIIFGDTYLPYMSSLFNNKDSIIYSKSSESERWTVVNVNDQGQIYFDDKKKLMDDNNKIVIGIFHILNYQGLIQILEIKNVSFYHLLTIYFDQKDFNLIETNNWVDYGHIDKYFEHKEIVESRSFNSLNLNLSKKVIRKTSSYTSKFYDEIYWAVNLPNELKKYIPKIHKHSLDKENLFIEMEYINSLTLHEMFVQGNLSIDRWKHILQQITSIINNFFLFQKEDAPENIVKSKTNMYLDKTVDRFNLFIEQNIINPNEKLIINNKTYPSAYSILDDIKEAIRTSDIINDDKLCLIHGDLCFPNTLYDNIKDEFKIIDPRGKFGNHIMYGDHLYEWAKIAHSVDGLYDFIIADKYNIVVNNNTISYNLHTHSIHSQIKDYFLNEIVDIEHRDKIILIQSLLFFSMLPLHSNNTNRQFIMLSRAVELFYNLANKKS